MSKASRYKLLLKLMHDFGCAERPCTTSELLEFIQKEQPELYGSWESRHLSAALNTLSRQGYVKKLEDGRGKRIRYMLAEKAVREIEIIKAGNGGLGPGSLEGAEQSRAEERGVAEEQEAGIAELRIAYPRLIIELKRDGKALKLKILERTAEGGEVERGSEVLQEDDIQKLKSVLRAVDEGVWTLKALKKILTGG
ncbi:MAG: hypothetical protein GXO07_02985 [Crenarchaeota archaeon]|nr:hypothetical protein [Thermoproteota archaeon]